MADTRATWSVNPVALAEIITGADLTVGKDPGQEGDLTRVQAMLERAFAIKGEPAAKLESIFESDGKDPARLDVLQQMADSLEPQELANILRLQPVRSAIELFGEEKIRTVLPYLVRVTDASFAAPGAEIPAGEPAVIGRWRPLAGPDYVIGDVSYLDPKQGALRDCYLISAMIALAWTRPDDWVAQVKKTGGPPYRYSFYSGPEAVDREVTEVTPALPLTRHDRLAYARSSTNNSEAWPGMFEKAYLIRELRLPHELREPTPDDYHLLDNRCEPQVACRALAGGTWDDQRREGNPPLAVWLGRRCPDGATTEPTMAWTEPKEREMGGLTWRETKLRRDHAYAVLGVMGDPRDPDYVVLRDPWGWVKHSNDHHAADVSWQLGGRGAVNLDPKTGVFALTADSFNKCMQAVGWVRPVSG